MFTEDDVAQLRQHSLTPEDAETQLNYFREGVSPMRLSRPCTVGDGIVQLTDQDQSRLELEAEAVAATGRISKFVPASGAASRMFKALLTVLQEGDDADPADLTLTETCLNQLDDFAFAPALHASLDKPSPSREEILRHLLTDAGLGYTDTPKGLIPFHRYPEAARTPFAEHLAEGMAYAADDEGLVRIHFTVSAEHAELIDAHLKQLQAAISSHRFRLTLSVQHPSTDTLAADDNNEPFRVNGRLLFRPGGHGALLRNLAELDGDIIIVKNIDNVLPSYRSDEATRWKRILSAYLAEIQEQVFASLHHLDDGTDELAEIVAFAHNSLHLDVSNVQGTLSEQRAALVALLNRPIRVCGVVRNQGEPGGGPFWVRRNGSISRQIVERAEIDLSAPDQMEIANAGSHFNPVDLVCGVRDYRGRRFRLLDYRDDSAVFLAAKSHQGRSLRALEWPGLWNGGMAHWITLFVETPLSTFNPVKTVADLLRPSHQPLA